LLLIDRNGSDTACHIVMTAYLVMLTAPLLRLQGNEACEPSQVQRLDRGGLLAAVFRSLRLDTQRQAFHVILHEELLQMNSLGYGKTNDFNGLSLRGSSPTLSANTY
jgi:hypothetical protein